MATSEGPIGAVVHEPDAEPHAALILLQDRARGGRAGPNSMWTRIARDAAGLGFSVVRFDYSREGDGFLVGRDRDFTAGTGVKTALDLQLLREVTGWFRPRLSGLDLYLAGSCFGASIAVELASEEPGMAGMLLVVPWLRTLRERLEGPADGADQGGRISEHMLTCFRRALPRTPGWILVGEQELPDVSALRAALPELDHRIELDVVPDIALYPPHIPHKQAHVHARLVERLYEIEAAQASAR